MTTSEIKENLCHYDNRNPNGVITYLDEQELKEEGLTGKAKENCACDNCFYGRTQLAEELLKYIDKSLVD